MRPGRDKPRASVFVELSPISRWSTRVLPLLEKIFRQHKSVGGSWRMARGVHQSAQKVEIAKARTIGFSFMTNFMHWVDKLSMEALAHSLDKIQDLRNLCDDTLFTPGKSSDAVARFFHKIKEIFL